MKSGMNKGFLIISSIALGIVICIMFAGSFWFYGMGPVTKSDKVVQFEVEEGTTYTLLADRLKEEGLIRSPFVYKLYIKLNQPAPLQAGSYSLKPSSGVKGIVDILSKGTHSNEDVITITFREGLNMQQIAEVIAMNTNNEENDVLKKATDEDYIDSLIKEYWFLSNDIKKDTYYPIEGYLFPDTYQFLNENVSVETIFETMLDEMGKKLEPIKKDIEESEYSLHEIVTLASMIQSEGNNILDFGKMASVFLSRLDENMRLESCASAYYGDHKIMGRDSFGDSYLQENDYNTYVVDGIPVGPISNPGIDAIESVLNPSDTDYLYFASDKNMKVYFSKTYEEHENTIAQLREAGNWYGS